MLVATASVGAILFGLELALPRPPAPSRVASQVLGRLQELHRVASVSTIGGSRRESTCTRVDDEHSTIAYPGARIDLAAVSFGRLDFRREDDRALLLAGCSRLLGWLLYRRLYTSFVHGEPAAVRAAGALYRVTLAAEPVVELDVERGSLSPRAVRVGGAAARLTVLP